jgi:type I restriction enzyme R subunit
LKKIEEMAKKVKPENKQSQYPPNINTPTKQAIYELVEDENITLAMEVDVAYNVEENWIGNTLKERKVKHAISRHVSDPEMVDSILEIIKNQKEYR